MNRKLLWVIALVLFLGVALSAAASSDLPGPLPTPLPGPFSLKVTVLLDNGDGTTSPAAGYTVAFASPFLSTDFGGSATFLTTDASGVATYTNPFNTSIMVQLPGPYFDGPEKWVGYVQDQQSTFIKLSLEQPKQELRLTILRADGETGGIRMQKGYYPYTLDMRYQYTPVYDLLEVSGPNVTGAAFVLGVGLSTTGPGLPLLATRTSGGPRMASTTAFP